MKFPRYLPQTYNEALARGAKDTTAEELKAFLSLPNVKLKKTEVKCDGNNNGVPCQWTTQNGKRWVVFYCNNGDCNGTTYTKPK